MAGRQDYDIILRAQNATSAAFREVRNNIRGVQGAAAGLNNALRGGFAALGISLAGGGIVALARDAADSLGNIADEAQRAGTSTDALQALKQELKENGGEANDAAQALDRFNVAAATAAHGGGKLAKLLTDNNVQLRDQSGNVRDAASLFVDYARLVANAGSQQEKLALAALAFGRDAGPTMVAMLEKLARVGLQGVIDKQREAGLVADRELINKAKEIDDAWDKMIDSVTLKLKTLVVETVKAGQELEKAANKIPKPSPMTGLMDAEGYFAGTDLDPNKRGAVLDAGARAAADAAAEERAFEARRAKALSSLLAPVGGPKTNTSALGDTGTKEKNRSAEVLAMLKAESDQITFNLEQRRQAELVEMQINLVRRAGVDASEEEKRAIEGAAAALQQKKIAFEEAQAAAKVLGDIFSDIFDIVLSGAEDAEDAIKKLIIQLLAAEAKAGFLRMLDPSAALGPISTILKGIGSIAGFRADGGPGRAGQAYVVGEKGRREVFVPHDDGTFMTERSGGGSTGHGGGVTNININLSGANGDESIRRIAMQGVRQGLDQYDRQRLPSRVAELNQSPRRR